MECSIDLEPPRWSHRRSSLLKDTAVPFRPSRFRPAIPALEADARRPLWSVMIPSYNSARFLGDTLRSVLAQDPGPDAMQIEVVDDHSTTDDPEQVVRDVAGSRVTFFRQPLNVGHVRNFNTCLARSRGQLIHLLHSDDQVLPGFYDIMQRPFADHPNIGCAWCRQMIMDEAGRWIHVSGLFQPDSGIIPDWLGKIAIGQRLQPPSIVVRRGAYETVGGFDERIRSYGEDWEMWVRLATQFPAWHQVEPLAAYRYNRLSSLTATTIRTGASARDLQRAVEINRRSLPVDREAELTAEARVANATGSLRWAKRMLDAGQLWGPLIQVREALRFTLDPRVLVRAYGLVGYYGLTILKRIAAQAVKR